MTARAAFGAGICLALAGAAWSLTSSLAAKAATPASASQASNVFNPLAAVACRLVGSTVLVPVEINHGARRWFILDTGASACVVDRALARRLGLATSGTGRGTGAGKGTVPYDRLDSTRVALGVAGQWLNPGRAIALDLSQQHAILGESVDGVLGANFFDKFVVEIDYESGVVRLFDPDTYVPAPRSTALELEFERHVPHVRARIKVAGHPAESRMLLVDTGSQDAVDDSLILRSTGSKATVTGGVGLGQEYSVTLARIERFELGAYAVEGLTGVAPGVALIGGEVLSRFRVTFDYPHSRMLLEPNRHLHDAPSEDASGLDLRLADDGQSLLVHDLQRGSAADEAGIESGDRITALDGVAVADLGLMRAQRMFMADGHALRLAIEHGGGRRPLTIHLRRWLPAE